MKLDFYIKNKFVKVGYLTAIKPDGIREKKHGIYFIGDTPKSKGVYIIAKDLEVLKFGVTNASNGMESRIEMYLSNPESTNVWVRENLKKEIQYEIYFYEIIPEFENIMGVKVEKSILPKSLEEALIKDYTQKYGMRPRLNKSAN